MAVNNVYILTVIMFVVALPFVFLMKRERGHATAAH